MNLTILRCCVAAAFVVGSFCAPLLAQDSAKPDWPEARVRSLLEALPASFLPHVTLDGHYPIALDMPVGGIAISDSADAYVQKFLL